MHQISVAALAVALTGKSNDLDIVVGAPYLNRNSEEDQGVIGLLLEPLPIRVKYYRESSRSKSLLEEVRQSSQDALSHTVPWHQLLNHRGVTPECPNHPIFDVMVTFNEECESLSFALPDIKPIKTWTDGAKFKIVDEFSADELGVLALGFEYSTECFCKWDIMRLEWLVRSALDGFATESDAGGSCT